jgi:mRNA interferase MazF
MEASVSRGDIFLADLEAVKSIQGNVRPVLVTSNEMCNKHSPVITAVPLTSNLNKPDLPIHVIIDGCGLPKTSIALVEMIMPVDKSMLINKIGKCTDEIMAKIDKAIIVQNNIKEPFDISKVRTLIEYIDDMARVIRKFKKLNELCEDENQKINYREELLTYKARFNELQKYCESYGYDHNNIYNKYKVRDRVIYEVPSTKKAVCYA